MTNPNEAREREALELFQAWAKGVEWWDFDPNTGNAVARRSARTMAFAAFKAGRASLEATSSAPIGDSTDSGLDRAVAASVDPKWLPVNAAGRAVKMLTAYAELVKATGKYAEMHYIPEIEYVIAEIEGAGEIVLPAWLRNGYETAEATQPASDATARTESAPATAEPAQAEARAPISDAPKKWYRVSLEGGRFTSFDNYEDAHAFASANSWGKGAVISEASAFASASQRDSLTPQDFGAVGDGVTDDSAAFQRWVDHPIQPTWPARELGECLRILFGSEAKDYFTSNVVPPRLAALVEAARAHIESLDAYESDLVPINRTRGTAAALRAVLPKDKP